MGGAQEALRIYAEVSGGIPLTGLPDIATRNSPEVHLTIRRLIVPLAAVAVAAFVAEASAQGAFPAPLPGAAQNSSSPFPPVNGAPQRAAQPSPFPPVNQTAAAPAQSPFPPVNAAPASSAFDRGAAPLSGGFTPATPPQPSQQQQAAAEKCMQDFAPLRKEAERRGGLIKNASDRKAPPSEACKLIGDYAQAEVNMIKYVEKNGERCGIPADIAKQLSASHKNTLQLRGKVCSAAAQMQQRRPAAPSLSEALGSTAMPEAKISTRGGSTFDTLSGNVLQR